MGPVGGTGGFGVIGGDSSNGGIGGSLLIMVCSHRLGRCLCNAHGGSLQPVDGLRAGDGSVPEGVGRWLLAIGSSPRSMMARYNTRGARRGLIVNATPGSQSDAGTGSARMQAYFALDVVRFRGSGVAPPLGKKG